MRDRGFEQDPNHEDEHERAERHAHRDADTARWAGVPGFGHRLPWYPWEETERCQAQPCDQSVRWRAWPTRPGELLRYYCDQHRGQISPLDLARQIVLHALHEVVGLGDAEAEAMVAQLITEVRKA